MTDNPEIVDFANGKQIVFRGKFMIKENQQFEFGNELELWSGNVSGAGVNFIERHRVWYWQMEVFDNVIMNTRDQVQD